MAVNYPYTEQLKCNDLTNRNYVLLEDDNIVFYNGDRLFRIQATRNIPIHGIKKGDLGGYVYSYDSIADNAWATQNTRVGSNAKLRNNALMTDNSYAQGRNNVLINGHAIICGDAAILECATVSENAVVGGTAYISGYSVIKGYAKISGRVITSETVTVQGTSYITNPKKLYISGNIEIDSATITMYGSIQGVGLIPKNTNITGKYENLIINGIYDHYINPLTISNIGFKNSSLTVSLNNANKITITHVCKQIDPTNKNCYKQPTTSSFTLTEFEQWVNNIHENDMFVREEYLTVIQLIKIKFRKWIKGTL